MLRIVALLGLATLAITAPTGGVPAGTGSAGSASGVAPHGSTTPNTASYSDMASSKASSYDEYEDMDEDTNTDDLDTGSLLDIGSLRVRRGAPGYWGGKGAAGISYTATFDELTAPANGLAGEQEIGQYDALDYQGISMFTLVPTKENANVLQI